MWPVCYGLTPLLFKLLHPPFSSLAPPVHYFSETCLGGGGGSLPLTGVGGEASRAGGGGQDLTSRSSR